MNSTGRYIVRYEPSDSEHEYLQTKIEMSISDEATFDDMAAFLDCFLKAAGFVYEGSLKVTNDKPEQALWSYTAGSSQATDFVPFDQYGNFTVK
jgi:hypothetical protein